MRSCCCVAQCKTCGQCCQVACGHSPGMGTYTTPNTTPWTAPPRPRPAPWPPGQIQVIPAPLTADDVRRIIREELDRGEK